ncbi:MAG: signal peptide peptidase SppA [Crocinitomicaceae bacterium]|nr:signal peptide peptidase SppA [Crocinitomicaceae bacterium]
MSDQKPQKKVTFGRIFWPSLVAALTVSILGGIIWAIIIGSFFSTVPFTVKDKTVLHMTLDGDIGEVSKTSLNTTTFRVDNQLGVANILFALKAAKKDPQVKGIFLEIDALNCGMATAREIRNGINDFEKSGKFVVAYSSGEVITTKEFYIASAANESYGFPSSNIAFVGLGAEMMYFKNLLDDLEIEMQVIRGSNNDFKSAVEPFFRTSMSDSARHQTETLLTGIWKDIRQDIAKDRKGVTAKQLDQFAEDASVITVKDAVKHKLIDATKYRDEVLKIIAKKVKVKSTEDIELLAFSTYAKKRFVEDQILMAENEPNIAVILTEGTVSTKGDGLSSEKVCKLIREARNNPSIKTVVLRVNSPGGSALASDEIWREVKLTNKTKKVIVSMSDVAASGGYFIAAPGATIFAQPTTITGSIGVFGVIPFTGNMLENKLGLTFDRVGTNKHSVMTTNRRLTEDEKTLIQGQVDEIYDQFKSIVAEGRGMTKEQVGVIARGRVWTGRDALKVGLVDKLGGLNDAIKFAAKKAGISEKKVLYYPLVEEDKLAAILEMIEGSSEEVSIKSAEMPKELIRYYEKLKMLESYTGIQMRMLLEMTID